MNQETGHAGHAGSAWAGAYGSVGPTSVLALPAVEGEFVRVDVAEALKRGTDVAVSLLAIAVTAPLWLAIAAAIKLTSRGPVFFVQDRAGKGGRPFRMIKFRSMVTDAEERLPELVKIEELEEPVFKLKDDPRVTSVGRFLRRFGLDELPQLLNVLRGEMSLVGPRPEILALVERYNAEQRRRLLVKPGITGYQQIHNRGMPDMAARLKFDLYYLRNRGLMLDLWILVMTVLVIASGREITY